MIRSVFVACVWNAPGIAALAVYAACMVSAGVPASSPGWWPWALTCVAVAVKIGWDARIARTQRAERPRRHLLVVEREAFEQARKSAEKSRWN